MDQRTPNLFIIGAPKAGTTFLHFALRLAPNTSMSSVKEPGFFTSSRDYRLGLDYYLNAYFAHAEDHAVRGESTPWYLYSEQAAERIAQMPTDEPPRFVVLVRRPSDRAFSMYRDLLRSEREDRSFERAVGDELDGLAKGRLVSDVYRRYVWCGRYAEHIERWQSRFGVDQVHVALFEDLGDAADRVWADLADFLHVDLGPAQFEEVSTRDRNPGGPQRWPRLGKLIRSFEGRDNPALERVKSLLPPGLHRRFLERLVRINRASEPSDRSTIDLDTRRRIDEACAEQTHHLEQVLGRSLPGWTGDVTGFPSSQAE